jgi:hypothetical protein
MGVAADVRMPEEVPPRDLGGYGENRTRRRS